MRWLVGNAWWLMLATAVVRLGSGLSDLLAGQPNNALAVTGLTNAGLAARSPDAYRLAEELVRLGGVHLTAIGALSVAVLLFGVRRNLAWAYWTMWLLPVMSALLVIIHLTTVAPGLTPGPGAYYGSVLGVIDTAALLVSAPRFFRRSSDQSRHRYPPEQRAATR